MGKSIDINGAVYVYSFNISFSNPFESHDEGKLPSPAGYETPKDQPLASVVVIDSTGRKHKKDLHSYYENHYEAFKIIGDELKTQLPHDERDQKFYALAFACQGFIAMSTQGGDVVTYFPREINKKQAETFEEEISALKDFVVFYTHVEEAEIAYMPNSTVIESISGTFRNYGDSIYLGGTVETIDTVVEFAKGIVSTSYHRNRGHH